MTIEEIQQLIDLANASGIAELEVERAGSRVRIRRVVNPPAPPPTEIVLHPAQPLASITGVAVPGVVAAAAASATAPRVAEAAPAPPAADPNLQLVKAPIVGTFYEAPSPGAPSFVKPGDTVQTGQVLCIIESMKLMNEIEAETSGVIVARLVENGRPVEYGEALFSIRPL